MSRRLLLFVLVLLGVVVATGGCSHVRMALFMQKDNPTEKDPGSVERGARAFAENCAVCHGESADGAGTRAATLKVRPTSFLASDYTKSAPRIAARIAYGNGSEMPAFSGKLAEESIWDAANYLRSLQKPPAR